MCSIQASFHHAMTTMRLNFSTHMAISLAILPPRRFQVCSKARYQFRNVVHANANRPIRLLLRQVVKILCSLQPHYAAPCSPKHHSPRLHPKKIPFLRVVPVLSKLGGGIRSAHASSANVKLGFASGCLRCVAPSLAPSCLRGFAPS